MTYYCVNIKEIMAVSLNYDLHSQLVNAHSVFVNSSLIHLTRAEI